MNYTSQSEMQRIQVILNLFAKKETLNSCCKSLQILGV